VNDAVNNAGNDTLEPGNPGAVRLVARSALTAGRASPPHRAAQNLLYTARRAGRGPGTEAVAAANAQARPANCANTSAGNPRATTQPASSAQPVAPALQLAAGQLTLA